MGRHSLFRWRPGSYERTSRLRLFLYMRAPARPYAVNRARDKKGQLDAAPLTQPPHETSVVIQGVGSARSGGEHRVSLTSSGVPRD